jgi:hypothetical protein
VSAALQQILDPDYLGDLTSRSLDEVRTMRAECQEVETGLSMLRRVVQGRLDIVGLELEQRSSGDASDLPELLARLPEVLSERSRTEGPGRLPTLLAPEEVDSELQVRLDELAPPGRLAGPSSLDDDELRSIAAGLAEFEQEVSARRRELFERIDALQAEITRRYREGEASVDTLLR